MIKLRINDKQIEAREDWTVLEAARQHGIDIPTLCYHESVAPSGACRLCMVELREGEWSKLVASCIYPVKEGINIYTESEKVRNVRRWIFEMLLADCPGSETIREMAKKYGVVSSRFSILKPDNTCVVCGLCQRVCEEVVGLSAISVVSRGVHKTVGAPFMRPTDVCVACGSCVTVCPTDAMEKIFEQVRKSHSLPMARLAC
jgi:NADH dehydrogenase/NADH:ubiquinone oxidoreductase subunit G